MDNFLDLEKENIANKLSLCREKLNISSRDLEETLFISKGTIAAIERGNVAKFDVITMIGYFFGMTLSELTNRESGIPAEPDLREKIREFHLKNNISDANKLLVKTSTIKVILTDRLIAKGYLDLPRTIDDILKFCKSKHNFTYEKGAVRKALNSLIEQKLVKYDDVGKTYLRSK